VCLLKYLRELTLNINSSVSKDEGLRVFTLSINSSVFKDKGEHSEHLII
jgi:hypothetical protein